MNYKLSDTDKIEVEAGDLRKIKAAAEYYIAHGLYLITPHELQIKYPAAFEESKEEWEDVTEACQIMIIKKQWSGGASQASGFWATRPPENMKIENNRIWRRKT